MAISSDSSGIVASDAASGYVVIDLQLNSSLHWVFRHTCSGDIRLELELQ
jgi:hypothetical protein